jgi:aspartate kinase
MKVFKFGGGVLDSHVTVSKLPLILKAYSQEQLLIVISAFGKTTNLFEKMIREKELTDRKAFLHLIRDFHFGICEKLHLSGGHLVLLKENMAALEEKLDVHKSMDFNKYYDQIVVYGEILASVILASFLEDQGMDTIWMDARELIKTDSSYRFAEVMQETSKENIIRKMGLHKSSQRFIIQGFIASDENNFSTTLGREGSDYTAAMLAAMLDAEEVVFWKDVEGFYDRDPKIFPDARLIKTMTYDEAEERALKGAKVLHPKTIEALKEKNIPVYISKYGTSISSGTCILPVNKEMR